jgi:ABC-2 type transport system permease protein
VAQGIGTLIFFPLMFFAGLWVPIPTMPNVLRSISHWTPLGAAVQSLSAATAGHGLDSVQLLVLADYGLASATAAARLFRWE